MSRAKITPQALRCPRRVEVSVATSEVATVRAVVDRRRSGRWSKVRTARWQAPVGGRPEVLFGAKAAAKLAAGTYRVRLSAADAAGNRSGTLTLRRRVTDG